MNQLTNQQFYNSISDHYDGMINIEMSVEKRKEFLSGYIYKATKSALDVGCGTGTDAIALAMLGVRVTGLDPSDRMIEKAKKNAERLGVNITFEPTTIDKLPSHLKNSFDLAVCSGNAVANIPADQIDAFLQNLSSYISRQGLCIIHILNYDLILAEKQKIVNITERDGIHYIRFYDFHTDKIMFNILQFRTANTKEYNLLSTPIYPYRSDVLINKLLKNNLNVLNYYGGFDKSKFDSKSSKDLVIIAQKSA